MRCAISIGPLLVETESDGETRPDLLDDLASRCIRLAEAMLALEPVAELVRSDSDGDTETPSDPT